MVDSEPQYPEEYIAERRRRSAITGALAVCVLLLLVVLAAYAQEALSGPRIITQSQTPGLCANGKNHLQCVSRVEGEKRTYLARVFKHAEGVQLEGDKPSVLVKRWAEGELKICAFKVQLYKNQVVILNTNEFENQSVGECGVLPTK